MIFNAFSIGKDMSMSLNFSNPTVFGGLSSTTLSDNDLGLLASFQPNMDMTEVRKIPINKNGLPAYRTLMHGWNGSFAFDRQTAALEFLAQLLQNAFYGGAGQITCDIQQTIYHPLGISYGYVTWQFTNSILLPGSQGDFRAEDGVTQGFNFHCPMRDLAEIAGDFSEYASLVNAAKLLDGQISF